MLFNTSTDLKGVQDMALSMKDAIMAAHDAILNARISQTAQANKHRRPAPFKADDLVYISTKNLSLPVGKARKLAPKFIGPYKIVREASKGSSYEIDLPSELKRRGIHPVFHASLLRQHIPNDDRLFPGRDYKQIVSIHGQSEEWAVDRIATHSGKGSNAKFQLVWKSGDRTWEPLSAVKHLEQLRQYYEALGIHSASKLPAGKDDETPELAVLNANAIRLADSDSSHSHLSLLQTRLSLSESYMPLDTYSILLDRFINDDGDFPGPPPTSWIEKNASQAALLFRLHPEARRSFDSSVPSLPGAAQYAPARHMPGDSTSYVDDDPGSRRFQRGERPSRPKREDSVSASDLVQLWKGNMRQFDSAFKLQTRGRPYSKRGKFRPYGGASAPPVNHFVRRTLRANGFEARPSGQAPSEVGSSVSHSSPPVFASLLPSPPLPEPKAPRQVLASGSTQGSVVPWREQTMDVDEAPTPRQNSPVSEVSAIRPPPQDSARTSEALASVKGLIVGEEDSPAPQVVQEA